MQTQNATELKNMLIDWDMTPAEAVTLYLEWGNNGWKDRRQPVRSKTDTTTYFLIDTWGPEPVIRLVHRNSEEAVELAEIGLPKELADRYFAEYGRAKGVYGVTDEIRGWLERTYFN